MKLTYKKRLLVVDIPQFIICGRVYIIVPCQTKDNRQYCTLSDKPFKIPC